MIVQERLALSKPVGIKAEDWPYQRVTHEIGVCRLRHPQRAA